MHFFKSHIFGIILAIILAVPTVALCGSFVTSLIQGKTPSEAVTIISEQLDSLFGRVSEIETKQEVLDQRVGQLENKANSVSTSTETTYTPKPPVELKSFAPDAETQEICRQIEERPTPSPASLIGDIKKLCTKITTGKYENQEQYDLVVENLKDKWGLLNPTIRKEN